MYILPFFTQLGCVCLPRFWLFFFCCVFMIWFSCFLFCLCIFVIRFSCCWWCSFVLQEQHIISQYSHISLLANNEIQTLHLCRFDSKSPNHHLHAKKRCKQFAELARCERVMTIREEFHFSWVYTFSATPRSLRIWATHPPGETGCDPVPPAQLCWSSSSSFPCIYNTTSWNWTVTKLI